MPSSSQYGKIYTALMVKKLGEVGLIRSVLDGGCGEGTYHHLLAPMLPQAVWTGIEIWEPYVTQFQLQRLYHRLIRSDLRQVDFASLGRVDLAIFGDVLEHMTKAEAQTVIAGAMNIASYVMISIPVVPYPQGEENGNPHEAHVKDDWVHSEVMASFPGITAFLIHDHIGVYFLAADGVAAQNLTALQQVIPGIVRTQFPDDRMAWGGWQIVNQL